MQIVNERGKLHNPYTKSGGLISGKITEIGSEFQNSELKVGDKVICLSSLTGLPMYIESIGTIDMQYGQAECTGYIICFETTHLTKWDQSVNIKHLMRLLDEEGNLLGVKSVLEPKMAQNVAIISSNLLQTMFYAKMTRQTVGEEAVLSAILDSRVIKGITKKDFNDIFGNILDTVHFADLNLPSDSVDKITKGKQENYVDVIINIDGTEGSESMASLLVKDKGTICYMSFQNGYSEGSLIADSLGKEIQSYSTYGHDKNVYNYSAQLIRDLEPNLAQLDKYFGKQKKTRSRKTFDILPARPAMQRIDDFIYSSSVTADMVDKVLNIAKYDCNVVIQGETGSGKEKVFKKTDVPAQLTVGWYEEPFLMLQFIISVRLFLTAEAICERVKRHRGILILIDIELKRSCHDCCATPLVRADFSGDRARRGNLHDSSLSAYKRAFEAYFPIKN
jgi:hypothetical protein